MKKLIPIFLILTILGCESKKREVTLFLYNQEDPFIQTMVEFLKDESKGKFNLNIIDSHNFQIIQNENIEKRILAGDDLMIVNPVDRLGAYSIINKLKANNIPVIFFNREPLDKDIKLWDKAYYVGTNGMQSAEMQTELIMEAFGNNPNKLNEYDKNGDGIIETIILKGEQGHQDAEIRTTNVIKTLKEKGYKINILITEVANWDRNEAYDKMQPIIKEYKDKMELIISNNDSMAIGAISALRQAGMFKEDMLWIPVVGIDGLTETNKLIKDGYMYGTVLNDSKAQAKAIVELTYNILNDKDLNSMSFELKNNKYVLIDYKIVQ